MRHDGQVIRRVISVSIGGQDGVVQNADVFRNEDVIDATGLIPASHYEAFRGEIGSDMRVFRNVEGVLQERFAGCQDFINHVIFGCIEVAQQKIQVISRNFLYGPKDQAGAFFSRDLALMVEVRVEYKKRCAGTFVYEFSVRQNARERRIPRQPRDIRCLR